MTIIDALESGKRFRLKNGKESFQLEGFDQSALSREDWLSDDWEVVEEETVTITRKQLLGALSYCFYSRFGPLPEGAVLAKELGFKE